MAGTLRDRLRDVEDEKDRWFRERNEQVGRLRQDVEDAGREAWNDATRAGVNLVARTPQELHALGSRVLSATKRASASTEQIGRSSRREPVALSKPVPVRSPGGLREAALQADTAVRGAANVLTFGGADHLAAGMDALIQPGGLGGWRQRYDANMAQGQPATATTPRTALLLRARARLEGPRSA